MHLQTLRCEKKWIFCGPWEKNGDSTCKNFWYS